MRDLIIHVGEGDKGRAFRATLLASVTADGLWPGGGGTTDNERPVWACFAASEQALRPFIANLRCGRTATVIGEHRTGRKRDVCVELLKSAGYHVSWQRTPEGTIATAFLADLFRADPGLVDPAGASFVMLPPRAWAEAQPIAEAELERAVRHVAPFCGSGAADYPVRLEVLRELVPVAALFAVYLDRRIRLPLVADLAFYLQILLASLDMGLAGWGGLGTKAYRTEMVRWERERLWGVAARCGYEERGTDAVGLLPGLVFQADHEAIGAMLAEQAAIYFQKETVLPWQSFGPSTPWPSRTPGRCATSARPARISAFGLVGTSTQRSGARTPGHSGWHR